MTKPLHIELAIRLSDGSFETKVVVPLYCSDAERSTAMERWLRLAGEAMALGVSNLEATLGPDRP